MSPLHPRPDDQGSSHALRSLLASVSSGSGAADHSRLLALFAGPSDAAVCEHVGLSVRGRPRPLVLSGLDTVMTTTAAAAHLGLAGRDSARTWLAQRGIRPVGRESGPSGQNLYSAGAVMPLRGQGRRTRAAYDRWRDAAGGPVPQGARVEQVVVDRPHGAQPSRLGKQAVVIRRSQGGRLVVRFDGEDNTVNIRPDLVRVRPVSTGQIIDQLEQLRDLLAAEDRDGR